MRSNSFTIKMTKKSNTELETILNEKNNYTEEAVQAVIWELENRNLIEKTETLYEETPNKNDVKNLSTPQKKIENNESPFEELVLPFLYSKKSIQGFTILFSTIFGAFLLMSNLKAMNKPKARIEVLIFGIAYTLLSGLLANYLPKIIFISLIFNLIGYAVLIEYFWKKNFRKELVYRKKQIWKPLIISISITILYLVLLLSPQISGI